MTELALRVLAGSGPAVGTPAAYLLVYVVPGVVLLTLGGVATALIRLTRAVTLLVHEVMPPDQPSLRQDLTKIHTEVAVMRATQISRNPNPGVPDP
jgi:hypothetical protein